MSQEPIAYPYPPGVSVSGHFLSLPNGTRSPGSPDPSKMGSRHTVISTVINMCKLRWKVSFGCTHSPCDSWDAIPPAAISTDERNQPRVNHEDQTIPLIFQWILTPPKPPVFAAQEPVSAQESMQWHNSPPSALLTFSITCVLIERESRKLPRRVTGSTQLNPENDYVCERSESGKDY